ncbi:TPA: hypothetical protein N0F65_002116 [Lagenidium giganteum]|uniref:Integrase catalytic domain-containing protein n=1 Tax=Lagenidium giganteum TaxID=4803 RepID=A0AAV2ZHJ5_9STRA|nr:TPA: hypothetical protein N0F65_002116 [Lagenidium giganteum]
MDAAVRAFTRQWSTCTQKKTTNLRQYGKIPYKTKETRPWFEVAVDCIGPFGAHGFRAITIIDTCTRLLEMAPLTAATSLECARAVDQLWFSRYPRPAQCVFDQGSEFKKEFFELLDSHLVIGDKMRTSQIDTAEEWQEFCSNVVFATRASYHTTMQARCRLADKYSSTLTTSPTGPPRIDATFGASNWIMRARTPTVSTTTTRPATKFESTLPMTSHEERCSPHPSAPLKSSLYATMERSSSTAAALPRP